MGDVAERVADLLKTEFRKFNVQWFVDDTKNDGPCDTTPWALLAEAAIAAMREPTETMIEAGTKAYAENHADMITAIWQAMCDAALDRKTQP